MPTELPPTQPASSPGPPSEPPRAARPSSTPDGGAYQIFKVAGIPIRVHWTFVMLLVWFAFSGLSRANSGTQGTAPWHGMVSILALFGCVVLHELGHALVAMRYGIRTRDIVLYPLGGLARLENLPRPRQELWIALAGPAVNVVIAGLLYLGLRAANIPIERFRLTDRPTNLAVDLLWANIFLVGFNMLPAFPMDGGRVLRSLIARVTSEANATQIAARIGQALAIVMGLFGLFGDGGFMLIILAFFVYITAGQEASAYQTRFLTEGHRVREAMQREFRTLSVGNSLREAADALLAGSQQDFPVVHGSEVVGVLSRAALLRGMATEGQEGYVAGVMERDFARTRPDDGLDTLLTQMPMLQSSPILVMEGDQLIGMVTQENLLEFLALTQLRERQHEERQDQNR